MPREVTNYTRTSSIRSPSIFYVSVEGEKTEVHYFLELSRLILDSRFRLNIVPREHPSHSAPKHILASMLAHIAEGKVFSEDQFWIVIDRDSWPVAQLDATANDARAAGVRMAFSNPCFELWMLLHLREIIDLNAIRALNARRKAKEKMVSEIRRILGSYNQNAPEMTNFIPLIESAISNARNITPAGDWFETAGSSVYRLLENLREEFP